VVEGDDGTDGAATGGGGAAAAGFVCALDGAGPAFGVESCSFAFTWGSSGETAAACW
jgi:hypothetical protein